jgi:soluble lytic murein transglycosylase-like protein
MSAYRWIILLGTAATVATAITGCSGAAKQADKEVEQPKKVEESGKAASTKKSSASGAKKGTPSSRKSMAGALTRKPREDPKRREACEKYRPLVERIAKKHDLEVELVLGVIRVESGFSPGVKSRVGATGLMQVMPRTGKKMECGSNLEDPAANIECGCRVLRRYLDLYNGNVIYGLSAYNTGPGNTNPSRREGKLPFNFKYVEKVLRWRNYYVKYGCF